MKKQVLFPHGHHPHTIVLVLVDQVIFSITDSNG